MQYFWSATFIAALVIGIGVWGLMFWSFALHRKKKGSPLYPKQTKENLPLEIVYTAIPMVLVMILFYFTVTTENKVLKMEANPDVTVNVTAFKWNWDFSYEGTTSPDGTADGLVHTIGSSSEIPMLILPTNKVIEYHLESARRHPLVLGPGLPVQARRLPVAGGQPGRQRRQVPEHHHRRGRDGRPLRRAVRPVPLDDELRGPRCLRRAVQPST